MEKSDKIFNPYSGRYINRNGRKGMEIQILYDELPNYIQNMGMEELKEKLKEIGIPKTNLDVKSLQLVYFLETQTPPKVYERINAETREVTLVNNYLVTKNHFVKQS